MTAAVVPAPVRLARIELRHNAMAVLLPVAVGLFWYQAYRKTMALPPLWSLRAMTLQNDAPLDFAMPVAGAACWMGWRENRRQMTELLAGLPGARLTRLLVTWAVTTTWAVAGFLACAGLVYLITAQQASGGGPLWWPLVVGLASVPALSALGFAAGVLVPSRFTAPLVVLVAFFGLGFSNSGAHGSNSVLLLSPLIVGSPAVGADPGVGTFYRYLADLSILQLMFAGGLTLALLGALGLPGRPGSWRLRAAAAVVAAAGIAAAGTAVSLVRTGSMDRHGMVRIPALHDAADDQPLRYTPACAGAPVPVCVNPMYRSVLPAVVSTLEPALGQIAGLPGVPRRLNQVAQVYAQQGTMIEVPGTSSGATFVLSSLPGVREPPGGFAGGLRGDIVIPALTRVLGLTGNGAVSPAQQAVFAALSGVDRAQARDLGIDPGLLPSPGSPAALAGRRFAALSPAARHAWLTEHVAALRDGQITVAQLP